MNDIKHYKQLGAAITLQAVKDYIYGFSKNKKLTLEKQRKSILEDLRSPWMEFITDGFSLVVAKQLEKHLEDIAERLRQHHEIV